MKRMANEATMDNQNSYNILTGGFVGLILGLIFAKPKTVGDAILAVVAGFFSCFVLAPMIAEICTNLAATFTWLSWMKATRDTALFVGIVGLCAMLGHQIVVILKDDVVRWIANLVKRKLDGKRNSGQRED